MWEKILLKIGFGLMLGMVSIIANTIALGISEIGNIGDIGYILGCCLSWIFFVFFLNIVIDKEYLKFPNKLAFERLKKENENFFNELTEIHEELDEVDKELEYYKNEALSRGAKEYLHQEEIKTAINTNNIWNTFNT